MSSLRLSSQKVYDRAVQALLERALRERKTLNIFHPFYRLETEERFALIALHSGQWNYARVAAILKISTSELEQLAWRARIQLAEQIPLGPRNLKPSCPPYDARQPWTQRFLDEEITSGQERFFFQNHLMACDSCRESLSGCRDLYYSIEKKFPNLTPAASETAWLDGLLGPGEKSFRQIGWIAVDKFFARKDIQILCLALILLAAIQYTRWGGK